MPSCELRVAVVGALLTDHIFYLDDIPEKDDEVLANKYIRTSGGIAANTAVGLRRLGAAVNLIAPTTSTADGILLSDDICAEDIKLFGAGKIDEPSPVTFVLITPGARSWIGNLGGLTDASWHTKWEAAINGTHAVFLDLQPPSLAIPASIYANTQGILLAVDISNIGYLKNIGWDNSSLQGVLRRSRFLMPSLGAALELAGAAHAIEACTKLSARFDSEVVVTAGADGAVASAKGATYHVKPTEALIVDVTGAGDAFHAAYLWARLRATDVANALQIGAVAAGLNLEKQGGQAGLPSDSEVIQNLSIRSPVVERVV